MGVILLIVARSAVSGYVWLEVAGYLIRWLSMGTVDIDRSFRRIFLGVSVLTCAIIFLWHLMQGVLVWGQCCQAIGYWFGVECQRRSPLSNLIGGNNAQD